MICNARQLAGFQTVLIFIERYFQTGKHLCKSDILNKDAGHWPVSLLKMSLCHRYFLAYFARKTNYLVSSSVEYWNIAWKSVQSDFNYIMHLLVIAQWFLCMSYLERITLRQYYSHLSMFYHMHLARFKYINAPQDHFLSQKKIAGKTLIVVLPLSDWNSYVTP